MGGRAPSSVKAVDRQQDQKAARCIGSKTPLVDWHQDWH